MPRRKITPIGAISIDRMADSFALTLRQERKSENTIYSYLLSVSLFADYLKEHDRDLTVDVSRDDVRGFIVEQTERNSASTALVRFKSLQAFFKFCVTEEELDVSPMVGMKAPAVKRGDPPIVSDDVLAKLLKARSGADFTDRRDAAVLRVFIDTGCRLSEVTNLRQGDVNRAEQIITVRGKGDRVREVTLNNKAMLAIDRYVRQLEHERPELVGEDGRIGDDKPLWVSRTGAGMSTSGITNILHTMCSDAGVPRLHWHLFRHTMAHTWLAAGEQEGDLMVRAGWSSRSMLDIYARATKTKRAHAAARKNALGDRV